MNKLEETSTVQGKVIPFNPSIINDIYNLRNFNDEETMLKIERTDELFKKKTIAKLCSNEVKLISGTEEYPSQSAGSSMRETERTWEHLIPYANNSCYNLKRVLLLYAI